MRPSFFIVERIYGADTIFRREVELPLSANERLEPLGNGINVVVSPTHTFGTDALLLAAFAAPRLRDVACDLGTGCGIIPLLWCRSGAPGRIVAVDIQPLACSQLERAVELARLEGRIRSVCADLREPNAALPPGAFTLVTANPPYYPEGTGAVSGETAARLARHETACTLRELIQAAGRLLKTGGRLCICHRPERLCDVTEAMRAAGIEPKRLRLAAHRRGKTPFLLLLEGKKGGRPGLRVEAELALENPDGTRTDELRRLYGAYEIGQKEDGA